MTDNFNYLLNYLEKVHIYIDKTEFEFQIQSHPDYPSLLAISDTLIFFKIDNAAINVAINQIELLPNYFIAYLNEEGKESGLYFIEYKNENYYISDNKTKAKITKHELAKRWAQIVLLAENSIVQITSKSKNYINYFLFFLSIFQIFILFWCSTGTIQEKLFLVFPILGLLFTIATLKDLFGTNSEFITSFCSLTKATSCESVINSDKWKLFKILNFSDLGIVFFSFQFFGFLLSIALNSISDFFILQELMLLLALPLIGASLYFQKFVEKKWCPLCLLIIVVLIAELLFVTATNTILALDYNFKYFFALLSALFVFYIAWFYLKKLLVSNKNYKENLLKTTRFERNYQNFKNNLFVKTKIQLPKKPIVLGCKQSKTVISIVTNPFCGHCQKAHKIVESILQKNNNTIQVNVIIKIDFETITKVEVKLFYRTLLTIYDEHGEENFSKALHEWFEHKNLIQWLKKYAVKSINISHIDTNYYDLNKWCLDNEITYTPAIFVNGYEYPQSYERETLQYFIQDLIEDSELNA